jgi:hypothetical protein
MKLTLATLVAAFLTAGSATAFAQVPAARTLALSFEPGGTVTLRAQNVTVRDILAEWAQKCGCYIVNADRLTGSPLAIPVLFEHATQASVLESLLRQAAGYVLTPRRAGSASPSNYEVIYVLATSTATSSPTAMTSYSNSPQQTMAVPISTIGAPDDEIPPVQTLATRTDNKPAAPPPAPKPISPGVSIVPIVPMGPAPNAPAPGTSTPAPARP